ncbi:trypsin-like peptidase domain-containing protein [Vibrio vulnificus]|nr:trypsin-like peptidase domain-containing protein [Vibrio vulnificus]
MAIKVQDKMSWVPIRIEMKFDDTSLSVGTAFMFLHAGKTYLVTNWHNVTGRDSNSLEPLSPYSAIPNKLVLPIPIARETMEQGEMIGWESRELSLYNDDNSIWYEHPEHGHKVDVAVIPLGGIEATKLIAANDTQQLGLEKITVRPSLDAFVLGYPLGISGGAKFPIWKRASIASEPEFDIDDLPKLLIDTATREGMSGSPVFAQATGYIVPEDKPNPNDAIIGEARRFVGIYSGRLGSDTFQAQLGIVWKERAIVEIIEAQKLGKSSFEI